MAIWLRSLFHNYTGFKFSPPVHYYPRQISFTMALGWLRALSEFSSSKLREAHHVYIWVCKCLSLLLTLWSYYYPASKEIRVGNRKGV